MSHPLSYFCDTSHTQQLMGLFGDRLEQLQRCDLIDVITVFSASCNSDESNHSEYAFQQLVSDMNIVIGPDVDTAFQILDGCDRSEELGMLFGLSSCLTDRREGQ